jgi:hypothetical protein
LTANYRRRGAESVFYKLVRVRSNKVASSTIVHLDDSKTAVKGRFYSLGRLLTV